MSNRPQAGKVWDTEIEIEFTDHDALQDVEELLADEHGVSLRESSVHAPELRSDLADVLTVALSSTGFTTAVSAVLIQLIKSKRVKFTVRRSGSTTTYTYDGPVTDPEKVLEIVDRIAPKSISD
jgi:hypothetical protein